MNARIVRIRELTWRDEVAWRALAARALEPNPLHEPDCLVPAARHQEFGHELEMVFAEDGVRFFACLPIRRVGQWHGFPFPFVTTQVRRMIYCGTPLVDPERSDEAIAAILTSLAQRRGVKHGRILVLQELAEGGPVDRAIQEGARRAHLSPLRYESWERGLLRRRPEADYEGLQNAKFRKEMRRQRRRLAEHLGAEPRVVDRSDDPNAIDAYIELEASGYKRETEVAMATVPGEPAYFREMCRRYAKAGRLCLFALEGGGQTIAMQIFLRGGEGLFGIKASYDEKFSRYAPGVQLHLASMDLVHHTTHTQWMDTCSTPAHEILLKLYPDRRRITSYFIPLGRNPLDHLVVRTAMALRPLHKRLFDAVQSWRSGALVGQNSDARRSQDAVVPCRSPSPTTHVAVPNRRSGDGLRLSGPSRIRAGCDVGGDQF